MSQWKLYLFLTMKLLFQFDPHKKSLKWLLLPLFSIFLIAFCIFIPLMSLSITNGFQSFVLDSLQSFHKNYTINLNSNYPLEQFSISDPQIFLFYQDLVLLKNKNYYQYVLLRNSSPQDLFSYHKKNHTAIFNETNIPQEKEIVLTEWVARSLHLHEKESIKVISFMPEQAEQITETTLFVSHIVSFDNATLDSQLAFINSLSMPAIFNLSPQIINKISSHHSSILEIAHHYPASTVSQFHDFSIVRSMRSQKILLTFILTTISFICFLCVYMSISTSILNHQQTIALFRLLGLKQKGILYIFTFQGFIMGIMGLILGFTLTICLVPYTGNILHFLEQIVNLWISFFRFFLPGSFSPYYRFELMPSHIFYITTPPIEMLFSDFLIQSSIVMVTIIVAALLPSFKLVHNEIIASLKMMTSQESL